MTKLTGTEVEELHRKHVLQSWGKSGGPALAVEKAEGIYYWDYNGKKYADMSSQLVNANLGHQNQAIVDAIKEQADKICFMSPAYSSEPKSRLAKLLVDVSGADYYKRVFFTCDGAEANENAIKMARLYTGRPKILSGYRSYHGGTLAASNATGDYRRFAAEIGGAGGFVKFMNPHMYQDGYTLGVDDTEATKRYLSDLSRQIIYEGPSNIAAILVESIVGANGILIPPVGYMEGIRALCDQYGILMICDEVMAGFTRTGKMFTWMNFDIKPDLFTFAKGVNGGYVPLGGVIASTAISEYFEENALACGLTYSGHTLACAAGVAAVQYYIDNKVCDHVNAMSVILTDFLKQMVEKHACVGEARILGLFSALEIVKDKDNRVPIEPYGQCTNIMPQILGKLKEKGFSTMGRENNVNICPPCIITAEELNEYLPILDEVLTWVDNTFL